MKRRTRDDLRLLNDVLRIRDLPPEHPLQKLWHLEEDLVALEEIRFEFHHLADDLRVLQGISGLDSLLKMMRTDLRGYENFRYELRLAASIARAEGQEVECLAGPGPGPDIIARDTVRGTRFGIACYRGRTLTPAIEGFEERIQDTMHQLAMHHPPLRVGTGVASELILPKFPPSKAHLDLGVDLFGRLWSPESENEAMLEAGGVKVARTLLFPPSMEGTWETRIRLLLPVPARERMRLTGSVRDKLARETDSWAGTFDGLPVFAFEESNFCLGLPTESLESLLPKGPENPFRAILSTVAFFGPARTKGRFRFEEIKWTSRQDFDLRLETFSDNSERFDRGHLSASFLPTHATYEWVVAGLDGGAIAIPLSPLSINRKLSRVPVPSGTPITGDALRPQIQGLAAQLHSPQSVEPLPLPARKLLSGVLSAARASTL